MVRRHDDGEWYLTPGELVFLAVLIVVAIVVAVCVGITGTPPGMSGERM